MTFCDGQYNEFFNNPEVVQIGTVMVNTRTNKVVKLLDENTPKTTYKAEFSSMCLDPMAEKYYSISPYAYCLNNPILFIDSDGRLVNISGDKNQEAMAELQKSVGKELTLSLSDKGGLTFVVNTQDKLSSGAQMLVDAINNQDITVNVSAKDVMNTSSGSLFTGGAFMGNTINSDPQTGKKTVTTSQEINPVVLEKMDNANGKPGASTLHEVTESYIGGVNALRTGVAAGNANVSPSEYQAAHNAATPQSGNVYQETIDIFRSTTNIRQFVCGANWYVVDNKNNKVIIQSFYKFPKLK